MSKSTISTFQLFESKGHINYNVRMQMKARGVATKAEYMAIIRQEYETMRIQREQAQKVA